MYTIQSIFAVLDGFALFTFGIVPFFIYFAIAIFVIQLSKKHCRTILIAIYALSMLGNFAHGFYANEEMESILFYGQIILVFSALSGLGLPFLVTAMRKKKQ